ncbi:hypothetical protein BJ741DRAFT_369718 [Chytriomyces cf. hyalinus JEL632]|nr:hypothetical protein BJ741DRAFT_369718 [Chytriomyces cf. hyalinus JEL632]
MSRPATTETTLDDDAAASRRLLEEATKGAAKLKPSSVKDASSKPVTAKKSTPVAKAQLKTAAKKKGTKEDKIGGVGPVDALDLGKITSLAKKEKEKGKDRTGGGEFDEQALDEAAGKTIDEEEDGMGSGEDADDGWESDLNDVDGILKRKIVNDPYITACKVLGVVPVSYFAERINTNEIILKHRGLGPKGAQAIASVLEFNNSISHLDLSDNWIESGGAHIGRSLQINRTLTFLNLSNNKLSLHGGAEIAEMLGFNGTLKTLILKGNALGDKEASLLAEGLRQNSCLQVLDLSYNQIGDLGAITLGAGLSSNDSIKDLSLAWNQIRVRGATGFLSNLKDNTHISVLSLQDNGIGENGIAVSSFLAKSNSIISLNIG